MRLEKISGSKKHLRIEPKRLIELDLGDEESGARWKHFSTKTRPRDKKKWRDLSVLEKVRSPVGLIEV